MREHLSQPHRLLIISHTEHYRLADGRIGGWGATVREIDQLATLFDEVTHLAWFYPGTAPESAIAYEAANIRLALVTPSGGGGWRARLGILAAWPKYARTILQQLRQADAVHVRCPANISLLAIWLLSLLRHPRLRWFKYAGNWSPEGAEPVSYKLQRWWLQQGVARAQVTVNGQWPGQPAHVHAFLNPCLTEEELQAGRETVGIKQLSAPTKLLFVGRLDREKGAERCLKILGQLRAQGLSAQLEFVGDGPQRGELEALATTLQLNAHTKFHGWLPRAAINRLYAQAHFILLPSQCSEGWPKVLSEAMAWGAVPLASEVSSIPQYLQQFQTGRTFAAEDISGFAEAVGRYLAAPATWRAESANAIRAAQLFSYVTYLENVRKLLGIDTLTTARELSLRKGDSRQKSSEHLILFC